MYNTYFFNISMIMYTCTFVLYLLFTVTKQQVIGKIAFGLILVSFFIHFAGLIARWKESYAAGYGYIPLSNMYESLIFFSWTIVFIYLIVDVRYHLRTIGLIVSLFAALIIASTSLIPGMQNDIRPLVPALQSNWLAIHVITCFLGYAAFTISFCISVIYMFQSNKEASPRGAIAWVPSSQTLDEINYKSIIIGFPMLTLGIITGAAWAQYAWGNYWSWDPKETWSLITWFIYAAFLHARYTREWRGKKAALLSIVGFCAVIFTYFGVNYVLSGMHSYL